MNSIFVRVDVNTHGALESGRIGVFWRTLGLWFLAAAQWCLRSRIDVSFKGESQ
jgi:hypothetical protein